MFFTLDNHDIISVKVYDVATATSQQVIILHRIINLVNVQITFLLQNVDFSKIVPQADFFAPPRDHVEDPKAGFLSRNLTGRYAS